MDLSTRYLGLELKNPFVPSSSPLSKNTASARELEDFGAGALVMHSIFQEQIEDNHSEQHSGGAGGDLFGGAQARTSRDQYLSQLSLLREALDIPVIASLNGTSAGAWVDYAAELEAAGAAALELNVYYVAADITEPAETVERRVVDILLALKANVSVPIGVKLSPYFSSVGHLIKALETSGADGVALFNRFYQPDIDLDTLKMSSAIQLSTAGDSLLAMRWIAILYSRTNLSLAATGGIHFAEDALKLILCGADVTHLSGTLLVNGSQQLARIHEAASRWLDNNGYQSIAEIKGMLSQAKSPDPAAFARGHYIKLLNSYQV